MHAHVCSGILQTQFHVILGGKSTVVGFLKQSLMRCDCQDVFAGSAHLPCVQPSSMTSTTHPSRIPVEYSGGKHCTNTRGGLQEYKGAVSWCVELGTVTVTQSLCPVLHGPGNHSLCCSSQSICHNINEDF